LAILYKTVLTIFPQPPDNHHNFRCCQMEVRGVYIRERFKTEGAKIAITSWNDNNSISGYKVLKMSYVLKIGGSSR